MRYPRLFLCAPFLILLPLVAHAQQNPLEADAVSFRYDSAHAQLEIDYGVLQHALSFNPVDHVPTAYTYAKAEIWENGRVTQSKDIRDTVRCACTTQAQIDSAGANVLLGATGFAVPYSDTIAAAFLWYTGQKNGIPIFDTIVMPQWLPDRDPGKFVLSGIELATDVSRSNGNPNPFEKASYIITPNPSDVFGENYSKLYYYTELYVPKAAVDPSQSVQVITSIIDPSGTQLLSSTDTVPLAGTTIPLILGLDIDGLASDSYNLRIQVKYMDAVVVQAEKKFFYASDITLSEAPPAPAASLSSDSILFAGSEFAKLTDAEADELIQQSMYWGDDVDKQQAAKQSTLDDKQHFLFSFWRAQDAKYHAAQPLDEFRVFQARLEEANQKYVYMKIPGWKTSQGRVLITYGPPKFVDHEYNKPGYKPFIIWQYDPDPNLRLRTTDRAEFDFVDRHGGGNFSLVNSNVIGENYDPNWLTTEALELAH